jgi:hypothetical protein
VQAVNDIGVRVVQPSRWLNGIVIKTSDAAKLAEIAALPFVKGYLMNKYLPQKQEEVALPLAQGNRSTRTGSLLDYGEAFSQISMVGGLSLHDQGYQGQGMTIAVLDGGFSLANSMDAFDSLRINGQIKGTLNLVGGGTYVYQGSAHGSQVLSVLAANLPGTMIGTAPKANYLLIRSEDTNGESLLEEYNWVTGAEYADSAGADIISSSLSYLLSADPQSNLEYEQLDGNTAPATRAADIAASKGMIVIVSAGNNGYDPNWPYVGFPADGDSVFSIGAVDAHGIRSPFNARGNTFDGRIKPDVMALGSGTTVVLTNGSLGTADGTSFATPVIAGLTACLWQAHPDLRNTDIIDAIRNSSTQGNSPDSLMGWGISDYAAALATLSVPGPAIGENNLGIYPNPFSGSFSIRNLPSDMSRISICMYDCTGRLALKMENLPVASGQSPVIAVPAGLPDGAYILKVASGNKIMSKITLKY